MVWERLMMKSVNHLDDDDYDAISRSVVIMMIWMQSVSRLQQRAVGQNSKALEMQE